MLDQCKETYNELSSFCKEVIDLHINNKIFLLFLTEMIIESINNSNSRQIIAEYANKNLIRVSYYITWLLTTYNLTLEKAYKGPDILSVQQKANQRHFLAVP